MTSIFFVVMCVLVIVAVFVRSDEQLGQALAPFGLIAGIMASVSLIALEPGLAYCAIGALGLVAVAIVFGPHTKRWLERPLP